MSRTRNSDYPSTVEVSNPGTLTLLQQYVENRKVRGFSGNHTLSTVEGSNPAFLTLF